MKARSIVLALVAVTGLFAGQAAHAISDGNYDPAKQGCTGAADNYNHGETTEEGCHNIALVVYDGTGHEYFGMGTFQTPEGEFVHAGEYWYDLGDGTRTSQRFDENGPQDPVTTAGTEAHPETGIHIYFGADDNLDEGEHDSSRQVNNGPSDGGAIQFNLDPNSVNDWVAALALQDQSYLLTHPLPVGDAGTGFCADGICISVQSQRRTAFQGGQDSERDVSNYDGKKWDPKTCAGPSDQPPDCGDKALSAWNAHEGTTYVEPGVQIYEDPDAQGSPEALSFFSGGNASDDPYPLPALYIGTCGIVIGGGDVQFPASEFTNDAGQIVIETGC
ncbi:MAG: hypothetical protein ABR548_11645 [Actinomycetota bacterium]|nr:hypothetical protein [Actinomycetota bacterium]